MKNFEELVARARMIRDDTGLHIKDALRVAQIEDVQTDIDFAETMANHQGCTYTTADVLSLLLRVSKLLR
jgi:hypothetical protein